MYKKLAILFFLLTAANLIYAQSQNFAKRDSLILVLEKYELRKKELNQLQYMPADTQKAILLWDIIINDDYYSNTSVFLSRMNELKQISSALNYKKGIGNAITCEATTLSAKQEYKKALELHQKALQFRLKINDAWGLRWSYFNIGSCYQWQNMNKEAMPWYLKSLKLAEPVQDSALLYILYCGLSGIYEVLDDKISTINCAENAVRYANSPNSRYNYGMSLAFLGQYYATIYNDFDKSDSILKIVQTIGIELHSFLHLSYYYNIKGEIEARKGNYGESVIALINSNAMEDSMGTTQNKPYTFRTIAEYIIKADKSELAIMGIPESKKYDEVLRYSRESLAITIPSNIRDITADNYKFISVAYEAKGDIDKAYYYFKKCNAIKDSLHNNETTATIQGLKTKYETEKQEYKIALLKKDNLLQQEEVSRQTTVRNSFIGGLSMILMISGVAFNRFKTKRNANRQLAINLQRLEFTQQQLIEQEKLASLGALTAGIAHEIKNPLNFINNFSELNTEIVEDLPLAKNDEEKNKMLRDLRSNFEKITGHGMRADSIVKNMMAHSNNEIREKESIDINEMCKEYFLISYKSVRVSNPEFKCELITNIDPLVPRVNIIAQDFSRVLINIFTNAFYAVNEHKLINPVLIPKVTLTTKSGRNEISIFIKDNGTGMPEAVREKIFEPFYTTKPAGQGTGLGLSLSFDIIKAHNGKIEVMSAANEYTEFKITLPLT